MFHHTNSCPHGWIDVGAIGCYYFAREVQSLKYSEALDYCYSKGGMLAEPTDSLKQATLMTLVKAQGPMKNWWIGATDEASEGQWRWESGTPWDYTSWYPNEPSNSDYTGSTENCAAIWSGESLWNDCNCDNCPEATRPVCQWPKLF